MGKQNRQIRADVKQLCNSPAAQLSPLPFANRIIDLQPLLFLTDEKSRVQFQIGLTNKPHE
jgi:hypothetical protein